MADGAQSRAEIRAALAEHGHEPNRSLGQNFLAEPSIVARIADIAEVENRRVVEVGAGTGTLTAELADRATAVVAFEYDRHLAPVLADTLDGLDVDVRIADVTKLDLCTELDGQGWVLVANLPYNVGTGIVLDALRASPCIDRLVVMVQREVAERFLARPGSKIYGVPSVIVGLHARGRKAIDVPRHVFEPPPKVDSAVVVLDRVDPPELSARAIEIAEAGFGQRRKMLRRSLTSQLAEPSDTLVGAGIDPTARAESLSPSDYVAIAREEQRREG